MMYFDSAATSLPKPQCVIDAVTAAMLTQGNPSRGVNNASLAGLRCITNARQEIARFFGGENEVDVAFCQNATMALNQAIGSVGKHIVTTAAEHNSVLRPVYRTGDYTIVPVDTKGRLDIKQVEEAIRPDTGAVVMTHASNVTGNSYDISAVGELCKKKGIYFIVDASQSAGLLPIDMKAMNITALCFSGHKSLYGPQGTGGICVKPEFSISPMLTGGSGSNTYSKTGPEEMPERLEAGTQNSHGIAGLLAGVRYVGGNRELFLNQAMELTDYFLEELRKISSIQVYGDLECTARTPVVALNAAHTGSSELAFELNEKYGICVRAGAHCAPLMHEALGTRDKGAVRFSFSHMNTMEEVESAVKALRDICS
ncbi:aminotransferase class V-fold PLP-dependent enzyme [Lacrimispora defluvii]|uniref:cysteine desulfurase n=1 Tax=Lacrimispora defluvii TaxID=2719233 RepID=A0ABX1W256_9FIRM|nr:aminotransferase class V-fold PLP-dependent enzyme [Lacrimispora defluvii]NNJ32573.1 aminotransferase class V-fold PLP-dependent enzyme [Lacrimispora defluvii]